MKIRLMIWIMAAILLAACATAATEAPATEHVCYGDAEKTYSILDGNPIPVLYQGQVVSWIHFVGAKIYASQYGGPANPIDIALTEGLEYTIEIKIKVNANTMGVLRLKGFVCGDNFYYYLLEEANPFFIG